MPGQNEDYWSENADHYIDVSSGLLRNIPAFETIEQLETFEAIIFQVNFPEALEIACNNEINMSLWKHIHKICFKDVYEWAGTLRTIRISKGTTVFAYPENIEREARKQFDSYNALSSSGNVTLENIADFIGELNVIHPFREGNGRTLRIILEAMCQNIGYLIDYDLTTEEEQTGAFIASYQGDNYPLLTLLRKITKLKD